MGEHIVHIDVLQRAVPQVSFMILPGRLDQLWPLRLAYPLLRVQAAPDEASVAINDSYRSLPGNAWIQCQPGEVFACKNFRQNVALAMLRLNRNIKSGDGLLGGRIDH